MVSLQARCCLEALYHLAYQPGSIFLISLVLVVRYIIVGIEVSGWLSVFLSIWFLSGITIITLGLLGVYIGKIFETVKNRPTYLIKEMIRKN